MTCNVLSSHVILYPVMSFQAMSWHDITTGCWQITNNGCMPCHIILFLSILLLSVFLRYGAGIHVMPCHIMSFISILSLVVCLRYGTGIHVMPCHIMSFISILSLVVCLRYGTGVHGLHRSLVSIRPERPRFCCPLLPHAPHAGSWLPHGWSFGRHDIHAGSDMA